VTLIFLPLQDAEAYARLEPALIGRLLEVRCHLVEAGLGDGIATEFLGKK